MHPYLTYLIVHVITWLHQRFERALSIIDGCTVAGKFSLMAQVRCLYLSTQNGKILATSKTPRETYSQIQMVPPPYNICMRPL